MNEKIEDNQSDRRSFFRRLAAAAGVGVAGMLLQQEALKPVSAATPVTTNISNTPGQVGFWDAAYDIISDSNLFWDNTNKRLGVGTTSPARMLHIRGSNAVFRMDRDTGAPSFLLVRTAPGDFNTVWKSFACGTVASGVNNGSFFIGDMGTAVTGSPAFRLYIDNVGKVGIGTTSPTQKLHVAGDFLRVDGAGNEQAYIGGDGAGADVQVGSLNPAISTVALWNQSAGTRMNLFAKDIIAVGNVGIGTSTPGFPLSFPNTLGDKISLWGASGNHYGFGIQSTLLQIHTDGAGSDIVFGYGRSGAFTETARIKGDGNVGIGTTAPGYKLHVVQTANNRAITATNPSTYYYAIKAEGTGGLAGWFVGKVHIDGDTEIDGTLYKSAGAFKIDHPLDPANKYLNHSFVESPDMKNIYDGVAELDANGEAWVELPAWFDALNKDFRYQLTAIGAPMPNLHIAVENSGNRFKIAGGTAGMKVSWQITGIRQDAYANANRIPVEQDKQPAGMPESRGD